MDEGTRGFFFGGDSYVMKYTYEINGNERYIIYFWQVGKGMERSDAKVRLKVLKGIRFLI